MYLFKRQPDLKSICSFVQKLRIARKSHYEVLNLRKNCTDKEIKDAFIKLSKEYHPDKNKSAQAQHQFVQIVEAYSVLSKPGSRSRYDLNSQSTSNSYVYKTYSYDFKQKPQTNQYSESNNYSSNQNSESYYGVRGVRKLPNVAIIILCFGVAIVGLLLQIIVISNSYHFHRKRINEKSMKLAEELETVRASARGKTNEMQTQQILEKIVTAANPSIATASLGQALANDKKNPKNDTESYVTDPGDISYNPVDDAKLTLYEILKNIISYIC